MGAGSGVEIAGVPIGPGHPCRVVAEISCNHNGSLENALRLIEKCARAGADFVKFQCFTLDEMSALRGDGPTPEPWASMGYPTLRDLYRKAETPHAWFPALVERCESVGVPWFSSVFGPDSIKFLKSLGCPAYKVSAWDEGSALCGMVVVQGLPVIASTRGWERSFWADLTLHCPPGYPQVWVTSTGAFEPCYVPPGLDGLSYHGTAWYVPSWAAQQGASMVEVHVQLDDEPGELDGAFSLTVSQLAELCRAVKGVAV